MFFGHFGLVVAGKAVVLRAPGGMAFTAFSIRITVVHREAVIKGGPAPGGGIVALRALASEVIGRLIPRMAGFAIGGPNCTVIKSGI